MLKIHSLPSQPFLKGSQYVPPTNPTISSSCTSRSGRSGKTLLPRVPRTNSDTNSRAITKSRKNIYIVAVENSESMEVQDWVTLQVVNLFSSRPFQVPGVYGGGGGGIWWRISYN